MSTWLLRLQERRPWPEFVLKACAALAILMTVMQYGIERWRLGIDVQAQTSITDGAGRAARVVLIDRFDRSVRRGDLVAVRLPGPGRELLSEAGIPVPSPMLPSDVFVKRVAATAGDVVRVTRAGVYVNGRKVAGPPVLAQTLHKEAGWFVREFRLAAGELFLIGDAANSYDSRYWGPARAGHLVGKARVVVFDGRRGQ